MKKTILWFFIVLVTISVVSVFALASCKEAAPAEEAADEEATVVEEAAEEEATVVEEEMQEYVLVGAFLVSLTA